MSGDGVEGDSCRVDIGIEISVARCCVAAQLPLEATFVQPVVASRRFEDMRL